MKKFYQDTIVEKEGTYYTTEYLLNGGCKTKEEIEKEYTKIENAYEKLQGVEVRCNYNQIFFPDSNLILCNNITSIDEFWYDNIENGSIFYYEDYVGNIFESYEEAQDEITRLEELKEEKENEIETEFGGMSEDALKSELYAEIIDIEKNIECLQDDKTEEIYQFYIIDDSTAEYLKNHTSEIIYYNDQLDIYVLCVTHWGTSWDYVGATFIY